MLFPRQNEVFFQKNVHFASCLGILGACYAGKIDDFLEKFDFYLHKVREMMFWAPKMALESRLARLRWRIVNSDVPEAGMIFTS